MKKESREITYESQIDFIDFKRRGLSTEKMSTMFGIPVETVVKMIQLQEQYKNISGVY